MVMLVYDLRTVSSHAVAVDGVLPSTDAVWQPQDLLPEDGVRTSGRLSVAGEGRFFFSGEIGATVTAECRRCLSEVRRAVSERVQWLFAEPDLDGAADDPDVYVFDPRSNELDLRPAVREQWLLIAPAFIECRENCLGLCPTCGADLNAGPCGCDAPTDDRWAGLRRVGSPDGSMGST